MREGCVDQVSTRLEDGVGVGLVRVLPQPPRELLEKGARLVAPRGELLEAAAHVGVEGRHGGAKAHGHLLLLAESEPHAERPMIGLEDPVEVAHNLGRVLTNRTLGIVRSEIQQARDHLAAGQPLSRLLVPPHAG